MRSVRLAWKIACLAALVGTTSAVAGELAPGRIRNPAGLQARSFAVYNPDRDEYVLGYSDGRPLVAFLSTAGVTTNEVALGGNTGVSHIVMAYNPGRGNFLVVWRNGSPNSILGLYMTPDLTPIGSAFFLGNGGDPSIAYSPDTDRYMVTFTQTINPGNRVIRYRMISGDPTLPNPILLNRDLTSGGVLSDAVSYGTVAKKFLIVYVKDNPMPAGPNITGALVNMDGTVVEKHFAIDNGQNSQQKPELTYSAARNRWVVGYEDWTNAGSRSADFKGALIAPTGAPTAFFFFAASSQWDVPGPLTYNSKTKTIVTAWRIASDVAPKAIAREFDPQDGSGANPLGGEILLSDLKPEPTFDGPFPLAAASRPNGSDPQALILWRLNNGGDGIHAGIIHLPPVITTVVHVDEPTDGDATLAPFDIRGWAVDPESPTGTGVDEVHIWAFPEAGGSPVFLGAADYGINRPGVGTAFGDPRFEPSGYELSDVVLPDGDYTITIFALSTLSGEFDATADVFLTVGSAPAMNLAEPLEGETLEWPFNFRGWAIDRAAPSGTGVDQVHAWAFPDGGGPGIFLGAATLGLSRPGVSAAFGAQFEMSGFELEATKFLAPGAYTFEVFARSTVTGTFNNSQSIPVTVQAVTHMFVDTPTEGSVVGPPFSIKGWAFNTGTPGSVGIDAVHAWMFPAVGAPVFLGVADIGLSRPGVATTFGVPELEPSGFALEVTNPLPLGTHTIVLFAKSTVSGTFDSSVDVSVTVSSSPDMFLDAPTAGAMLSIPFTVRGWAVDLDASLGTGVSEVHVWAFPSIGGAPTFLGAATTGISRPDVAAFFGDAELEPSGFELEVSTPLAPGSYTITAFARSTVTGTFNNARSVDVVIP